jgi:photosystem II stability/assembly factor-like uncharacterized protein
MRKWQSAIEATWVVFLLASLLGCTHGAESPTTETAPSPDANCVSDTWVIIKEMDFGQPTISTMFGDESFGIATDLGGGIHYTEDGGETWNYATRAGRSRVALEIVGENLVWHIGLGGGVIRSTDGAHTWEWISSLPHSLHVEYVSFADENTGWAVTTELRTSFVTNDGAKTWSRHPFPEGMDTPAALHLRTPRDGYLLDVAGNLFITRDGGATWDLRSLGLEDGWTIPGLNHSAAMRFTDENHGLIALNIIGEGSGRVFVLRTEDGGATWTEEPLPVPMGMFHLTRDGVYLTHADLLDFGKITLLCSTGPTRR